MWSGQCYPKGSGEERNSIYIGKYGEDEKPIINADVESLRTGGALALYNQSWWTIEDLELTNGGEGYKWKYGLSIYNEGVLGEGYVIRNVTVHDVSGEGNGTETADHDSHWNGGIVVRAEAVSGTDDAEGVADKLVGLIMENGNKLTTGFVGTPYFLQVLSDNGYTELAYTLILQEEYPLWLFSVNMGATTIW